jgi:hypothetical protein
MKKWILISLMVLSLAGGCVRDRETPWPRNLNILSINVIYPVGHAGDMREGVLVKAEEISSGAVYSARTDSRAFAEMTVPGGIYRISVSDRIGRDIFNGSADKVVVMGGAKVVDVTLTYSRAGTLVIKELYCGGCSKAPKEGTNQADQYVILHNNDSETMYLDSLCLGTLSPYNSNAVSHWNSKDPETGETVYPDFAPIIQAVWQVGGDGTSFPLAPGEDAVICFRGAIDHSAEYPLSVNLNKSGYFVCYSPSYFYNTAYHPAPGDKISADRYLDVVVKTGQANAYTLSLSSPTLVVFKAEGTTIQDFVKEPGNILQTPGSTTDNVVAVPYGWVIDALEVFDGRSSNNSKRLNPSVDAGFVVQSDVFKGHTLMRKIDEKASAEAGYEILEDTNNSSNDFYERDIQSLHAD